MKPRYHNDSLLIAAFALILNGLPVRMAGAGILTIRDALKQPDAWYSSDAGRQALENVLSHQSVHGDWPKNQNTATTHFTGDKTTIKGTFDNGATTGELRLLARALAVTNDLRYRAAFLKGLDHVLAAQYPNGGWPQYSPPPSNSYHRHITFNDDAMRRLLEFLRDVGSATNYSFVPTTKRDAARMAFDRGIDCILKCQVTVRGAPTAWCAQHDEITLRPRPGRAYELVSLSGAESAGLLLLLMSLEKPGYGVTRAVHAGAKWFETSQLTGIRETRVDGDKRIVRDDAAPPLWVRFYEIETGRPIFCGRDGVKKQDYAEIEAERRNGYAWYGTWGDAVAERYAVWRKNWPEEATKPEQ